MIYPQLNISYGNVILYGTANFRFSHLDISIHLNLFLAFFLLTSMLFINLLGEQLAALVCIEKVLSQLVSLLAKAVERSSHHTGLSLKFGADKSIAL